MSAVPSLQLSSGTSMPVLGYGTWLTAAAEVVQGVCLTCMLEIKL